MSLNFFTGMGRLTKDPELRYTANSDAVVSFTVAIDDDYDKNKTVFVECVAWRKTAEFVSRYFKKGKMIAFSGRYSVRHWEKDGSTHYKSEIVVEKVWFCGDREQAASVTPTQPVFVEMDGGEEELPF